MSSYCKCFHCIYSKKKYLDHVNEISKTESLIYYYDTIHKKDSKHSITNDFKQIEYNETLSQVYKLKQKLRT